MRRRRRAAHTWFPTIGAQANVAVEDDVSGRPFTLEIAPTGAVSITLTPVTLDQPAEAEDVPNTPGALANVLGTEYTIKRIVGKIHAALEQKRNPDNDPSTIQGALIAAGFFVARVNDPDFTQPIGGADVQIVKTSYNPFHPDCIREPWLWRRTWVLGNSAHVIVGAGGSTLGGAVPTSTFPRNTEEFGDGFSGSHIDIRVGRRVGNDERLFFVIAGTRHPVVAESEGLFNEGLTLDGYLDIRILGSLRRAHNRSTF